MARLKKRVKKENAGHSLTDDGHTVRDLEISGCNLDTPKRKNLLEMAVRGFAVDASNEILSVRATADNIAHRKHALIQAMLAINDLFYIASSTVRSLFKEDVEAWLRLSEIRFLVNVPFVGKTGYLHNFDFAIPPSGRAPERIMRAVSNPTKDTTESFIFSWLDTREVRPSDSVAIAMLNDQEKAISGAVFDALRQYDIQPVRWSKREANRESLAA